MSYWLRPRPRPFSLIVYRSSDIPPSSTFSHHSLSLSFLPRTRPLPRSSPASASRIQSLARVFFGFKILSLGRLHSIGRFSNQEARLRDHIARNPSCAFLLQDLTLGLSTFTIALLESYEAHWDYFLHRHLQPSYLARHSEQAPTSVHVSYFPSLTLVKTNVVIAYHGQPGRAHQDAATRSRRLV